MDGCGTEPDSREPGKKFRAFDARRLLLSLPLSIYLSFCLFFDLSSIREGVSGGLPDLVRNALKTGSLTINLFALVTAGATCGLLSVLNRKKHRIPVSLLLLSVLFAYLNTAALFLFHTDSLPGIGDELLGLFDVLCGGWLIVFFLLAGPVLMLYDGLGFLQEGEPRSRVFGLFRKHVFLFSFLLILFGWAAWLVCFYPASMEWDVYDPILRFLRIWPPNDHHPWFYACVVGGAYRLGIRLGDKNIGIFLYVVIRAIFMAAVYARCVSSLHKSRLPLPLTVFFALFFAVTPVWGSYAKHAFKDTIGAATFCWFILVLTEIIRQIAKDRLKAARCLEYAAAGLAASLFRKNSIFIVVPVTLLLAAVMLKRKQKFRLVAVVLMGVFCFELYQGYIFHVVGVEKGNIVEALSIPLQQTARTVKFHSDTITPGQKKAIDKVLEYDTLADRYDPLISDDVKAKWHGSEADKIRYIKTWVKMFFRYPDTYIEAFIAHSSGYYAFTPEYTEAQRYGPGSHYNVGMAYFDWVKDPRFEDDFTCDYVPGLSGARDFLSGWANLWHRIPVLNLTDSKPLYTWMIVLMFWLFFKRKEYLKLLPPLACLLMVLTCIASPVNDCFRYYAPAAAAFPALFPLLTEGSGLPAVMER